MGRLIYLITTSLDGYINDEQGNFDWTAPSQEQHALINDIVRPIGTHLYGRRNYDVMAVWETIDDDEPVMRDFAQVWRATEKVVYSRTLDEVSTSRTRLERELDPDAVRALVAAADTDVLIGGATLAGQALAAGLVDELHVFVTPFILGGGTRWLPDGVRLELELQDERRLPGGVVHLHHTIVR